MNWYEAQEKEIRDALAEGRALAPHVFDIGHRAGCRDGIEVTADGRVLKWLPAGHADGRYPFGERAEDITAQFLPHNNQVERQP